MPRLYCVRPNSGWIQPHSNFTISVVLYPFTFNVEDKGRHKFLIQSAIAAFDENADLEKLWHDMKPNMIKSHRLNCTLCVLPGVTIDPFHDLKFFKPGSDKSKANHSVIKITNDSSESVAFQSRCPQGFSLETASGTIAALSTRTLVATCSMSEATDSARFPEPITVEVMQASNGDTDGGGGNEPKVGTQWLQPVFESEPTTDSLTEVKAVSQSVTHASAPPPYPVASASAPPMDDKTELRSRADPPKSNIKNELREHAMNKFLISDQQNNPAGQNVLSTISSVPPVIFLILAFVFGILLGKFLL